MQRPEVLVSRKSTTSAPIPVGLLQVFWNLLNNAQKFTPPGCPSSSSHNNRRGESPRIEVIDSGFRDRTRVAPAHFQCFRTGRCQADPHGGRAGAGVQHRQGAGRCAPRYDRCPERRSRQRRDVLGRIRDRSRGKFNARPSPQVNGAKPPPLPRRTRHRRPRQQSVPRAQRISRCASCLSKTTPAR